MTKITAPVKVDGEITGVGGLVFTDGVAETDDVAVIAYCEQAGYGIGSKKPTASVEPDQPIDSRDVHASSPEMVGTPLRDASVDPQKGDYLAPVNAGKADPHGGSVVAPGIHGAASGAPLVPGAVHADKETEAAERVLADGQDVGDATKALAGDDTGPIGMSDPSSGEFADTGIADSAGAVKPAAPAKRTSASRRK